MADAQPDTMNVKKEVLVILAQARIIQPGYTGQIIVHVNCGGVTRIERQTKEAVA